MGTTWWSPQLNALLGSLVVAAGAWLAWDSLPAWGVFLITGTVAGFLVWQGRTIGLVWAWATLLLGLESLAFDYDRTDRRTVGDDALSRSDGARFSCFLDHIFLWVLQTSPPAHRR
jgi:hypothetical protein